MHLSAVVMRPRRLRPAAARRRGAGHGARLCGARHDRPPGGRAAGPSVQRAAGRRPFGPGCAPSTHSHVHTPQEQQSLPRGRLSEGPVCLLVCLARHQPRPTLPELTGSQSELQLCGRDAVLRRSAGGALAAGDAACAARVCRRAAANRDGAKRGDVLLQRACHHRRHHCGARRGRTLRLPRARIGRRSASMLWLLPCALQVRALRDIACLVWSPIYRERRTAKPVQVHAGGACGLRRARLVGCTADAYGDWHDEGRKALWVRAPFGAPRAYLVKSLFQPTRAA